MTTTTNWTEATAAVERAESILIVTHVNPDGDAIGSLLGLALALRERGKTVKAVVDDGVPGYLKFLPKSDTVDSKLKSGRWDVMISVDASDEARTGQAGAYGRSRSGTVINLDHHATNIMFGDIFLVMPEAVSATEIVFLWLEQMGYRFSAEVATALLAGLVTDTMGFRTSNVTAGTLGIAQKLMSAGASLSEVTTRALINKPYSSLELWKLSLPSVRLDGGIISGVVTRENLKQAGIVDTTDAGLVGLLIAVEEAMVAVVYKELSGGRIEISLRSKPGFDVAQVAFAVGGGGHKQASGATVDGPLEAAQARINPMLQAAVKEGALVIA